MTSSTRQLAPNRSDSARVTTLELFFDLVFVLAIAQCTSLMSAQPTWTGLARGLVVLGTLWWSWVGYAWLTSVLNPELVAVRVALLGAMAGFVVSAMCVPEAFADLATLFAVSYGVVRIGHVSLFWLASRDDPSLRRSVTVLGSSMSVGVALLLVGASLEPGPRLGVWLVALLLDLAGPFLFGAEGWRLVPGHFAERHGLVVIIALGESIVAIGVGATHPGERDVIIAAVLGTVVAGALWWYYFDVLAHVAERRLSRAEEGRVRNEMARDAYSFLHYPLIAGIVLLALGLKKTVAHVHEPLTIVGSTALLGGTACYLLAIAAFGRRTTGAWAWDSVVVGVLLAGAVVPATEPDAIAVLAALTVVLVALVLYKVTRYSSRRNRVRRELVDELGELEIG